MRVSRLTRLLVLATASASLATVALSGPAGAAALKIKCSGLTGTAAGTIKLTGCNGNTGGGSKTFPASSFASGGTIPWLNGKTTTVTLSATSGEGSTPGVDKSPDTASGSCPATSTEFEAKGTVTGDTTGSATVGGPATGEACLDGAGNITIEPGSKLKLK
jgi:hypothetical protein